jgi:hypothetical protein
MAGSEVGSNPKSDPSIYGLPESQRQQAEQTLQEITKTSDFVVSPFVDGPLSALEVVNNITGLKYPVDLGTNSRYKYAMRMLIFRQEKAPQDGIINTPSPYDDLRLKAKASQANRINYDIVNARSIGAVSAAAVGGLGGALVSNLAKVSKNPIAAGLGKFGSDLINAGIDASKVVVAGFAASEINKSGASLQTKPLAYINLFMPDGLTFTDRHDYDSVSVTDALGTLGVVTQGSKQEILGRIGETASVAGLKLLGQNFTELSLYNSGYALNPQLEVLFKSTKNREFVFTFKFSPRNKDEADEVQSIIRTLRYHASTNFDTRKDGFTESEIKFPGSRYIIPPSQFEIEFLVIEDKGARYNDKLPRIAPCVLTNVDVNYSPAGQFAAYTDGNAVETQLQLTFTETVILTKDDIKVGY